MSSKWRKYKRIKLNKESERYGEILFLENNGSINRIRVECIDLQSTKWLNLAGVYRTLKSSRSKKKILEYSHNDSIVVCKIPIAENFDSLPFPFKQKIIVL